MYSKSQCLDIQKSTEAENYIQNGGLPEMQIFNEIGLGTPLVDFKTESLYPKSDLDISEKRD